MKKYEKVIVMSAAALAMTAALTIQSASAYFTTYVEASGGHEVSLGATTEIHEEVKDWAKEVKVKNTSDNECFVRIKVFSGSQVTCTPVENNNWTSGEDGYWYYGPVLGPRNTATDTTDTLNIKMVFEDGTTEFNVVVVQECTPAIYNEDGNPEPDWNSSFKGEWQEYSSDADRKEAGN